MQLKFVIRNFTNVLGASLNRAPFQHSLFEELLDNPIHGLWCYLVSAERALIFAFAHPVLNALLTEYVIAAVALDWLKHQLVAYVALKVLRHLARLVCRRLEHSLDQGVVHK
jgi:hypothetical protein